MARKRAATVTPLRARISLILLFFAGDPVSIEIRYVIIAHGHEVCRSFDIQGGRHLVEILRFRTWPFPGIKPLVHNSDRQGTFGGIDGLSSAMLYEASPLFRFWLPDPHNRA